MSTSVEEVLAPEAPARSRAELLRRADGLELLGRFEGSGFREPPLLARRADGQVVQLTELLYAVAEAADGTRDAGAIAASVRERCTRRVSTDNVRYLADRKLRPLGVLALADGTTPELPKREPLMALRHRKQVLPADAVNAAARPLTWLHRPFVTLALLLAFGAFDAWLFFVHGVAGGLRSALYSPELLLAVLASVVVATAFHEFGHASACRYGGGRAGHVGIGLYVIWPAFYCDVTDAYRLDRKARLRTDLGGVYFNSIFTLLAGAVFFATGEEVALLAAAVQHVVMLQQLLPLLRFDGYYVLTDLTGVPDILSRIKPIFRSLLPGRPREPQVDELKPWVRFVVTAYLVTLVPTLIFFLVSMAIAFPRVLATVHDSFGLQLDRIVAAEGWAEIGVGVVRMLMLVLPVVAMSVSLGRTTKLTGLGLVRWSRGSAPRTAVAAIAGAAALGALGYVLWPNGDYEPIRPGERGTVGEALSAVREAPGGRPYFTPEHEVALAAVPTVREAEAVRRAREATAETEAPQAAEETEEPRSAAPARQDAAPDGRDTGPWYETANEPGPYPGDYGAPPTPTEPESTIAAPPPPSDPGTTPPAEPAPTTTETAPAEPAPTPTETAPTEPAPTEPTPTETTPTEPPLDGTGTSTTTTPTVPETPVPYTTTTPTP
jgi:putative peptide zinc metalloprotease protein